MVVGLTPTSSRMTRFLVTLSELVGNIEGFIVHSLHERFPSHSFTLFPPVSVFIMTATLSPEFVTARDNFAAWYDAKPEEIQYLIDEISDRTSFIIDEADYDNFIEQLADYGITTAEQFEERFNSEYEGYGEHIYAKFAEEYCEEAGLDSGIPELFINAIDYEQVYYQSLQYDFIDVDFRGNRYFFYNH